MNRTLYAAVLASLCLAGGALAQTQAPQPILPEDLKWGGPPDNPKLKGAWVVGNEKEAGSYALRVRLARGGRIPAHTHPDTRYSTVLSGTLYVGFGDTDDDTKMFALPPGGVYVAPAGAVHRLWAKDGDVEYQESGVGPTATDWIR